MPTPDPDPPAGRPLRRALLLALTTAFLLALIALAWLGPATSVSAYGRWVR